MHERQERVGVDSSQGRQHFLSLRHGRRLLPLRSHNDTAEVVGMYLHVAFTLSHERQHFIPISQSRHWHHVLVGKANASTPWKHVFALKPRARKQGRATAVEEKVGKKGVSPT